jgi:PhnB protein
MPLIAQISLVFNGQCEAAFRTYARCLDGTIAFMLTWGQSPMAAEAPAGWEDKIYHATLKIGDTAIMGGDLPPNRYEAPKGFSLALQMNDPVAADRIFEVLAEGARIEMPLQETFWASRFGVLIDRFGIPWSINCEKPETPQA